MINVILKIHLQTFINKVSIDIYLLQQVPRVINNDLFAKSSSNDIHKKER